jgi:hypothetical protein
MKNFAMLVLVVVCLCGWCGQVGVLPELATPKSSGPNWAVNGCLEEATRTKPTTRELHITLRAGHSAESGQGLEAKPEKWNPTFR